MSTALMIDYPELPAALTNEEHAMLQQCEQTIRDGLDTFYAVGHALATVNQQKLYREEYRTFEAYCREKWQMGKAQAYRLIDAEEVRENLSPIGDEIELPKKESHVRALKKAPAELQADIWQGVQMSGQPVTAKRIEEAVKEAVPQPEPSEEYEPGTNRKLETVPCENCGKMFKRPDDLPYVKLCGDCSYKKLNPKGKVVETRVVEEKDLRTVPKGDGLKRVIKGSMSLKYNGMHDTSIEALYNAGRYVPTPDGEADLRELVTHCQTLFLLDDPEEQVRAACLDAWNDWKALQAMRQEREQEAGKILQEISSCQEKKELQQDDIDYIATLADANMKRQFAEHGETCDLNITPGMVECVLRAFRASDRLRLQNTDRVRIMHAGLKLYRVCELEKVLKQYTPVKNSVSNNTDWGSWKIVEKFTTKKAIRERQKELEQQPDVIFDGRI